MRRVPRDWASSFERRLQLVQPSRGIAVAWCAPVAAGAKRAAGRDLGRIGDGAALVLADLEEAEEEGLQPFADRGEVIVPLQGFRIVERPEPGARVPPRLVRKEGDLGRRLPVTKDVVEEE